MKTGRSRDVIETFIQRGLSAFICLTCLGCFAVPDLPVFPAEDAANIIDSDAQSEDVSVPDVDVGISVTMTIVGPARGHRRWVSLMVCAGSK